MKYFQIKELTGDVHFECTKRTPAAFINAVTDLQINNVTDQATYWVNGSMVEMTVALKHAGQLIDAAYEKKCTTHKQITYFTGVSGPLSVNNKHTAWVRK